MSQSKRTPLNYSGQCLTAIARALPEEDDYRFTIEEMLKDDPSQSLEEFSQSCPEIPLLCGLCDRVYATRGLPFSLDNVTEYGSRSHIVKAYTEFCNMFETERSMAMFMRIAIPKRLNVVVHDLNMFRMSWDPEILVSTRAPNGAPLFVERRTTFCRLFASIGLWSLDRPGHIVSFHDGDGGGIDLRTVHPSERLRQAIYVAGTWGHRRTRSKMFRDLSDEEFIEEVMEMQMERRIETGSWL